MRATTLAAFLFAICVTAVGAGVPKAGPGLSGQAQAHDVAREAAEAPAAPLSETADGLRDERVIERRLGSGPAESIVVTEGDSIRLVLHAPEGTELHLHGYDIAGTAGPRAPVVMTFRAIHVGRFPIEAHGMEDSLGRRDRPIAYLEVRPE